MKERTFCTDEAGREIFIGDTVLVSLSEENPVFKKEPFCGIVPPPFMGEVLPNRQGISGFMVRCGAGFLVFEDDGEPAWEVRLLAAA